MKKNRWRILSGMLVCCMLASQTVWGAKQEEDILTVTETMSEKDIAEESARGRGTGSYIRGKRGYAGEGRKRTSDRLIAGGDAAGGIFAGRRVSAGRGISAGG